MDQVLFVLHEGAISQWWLNRGKLSLATLKGLSRLEFSDSSAPQFWDWWVEDNNAEGDSFDAIFLSSSKAGFGDLPKCFLPDSKDESAWTLEKLSLLANEPMFSGQSLTFVCGKNSRLAPGASEDETPLKLVIQSSLKFTLPKEEPKKEEVKPEPVQNTLDVRKFKADVFLLSQSDRQFKIGDKCIGKFYKLSVLKDAVYLRIDGVEDLAKLNLRSERTISHPHEESVVWDAGKAVELCVVNVDERRVYFEAKV